MINQKQVSYPGAGNTGMLYRTSEQHEADKIRQENSGMCRVLRALGGSQNILVMSWGLERALSKPNYHNSWSFDEKAVPKGWKRGTENNKSPLGVDPGGLAVLGG